jgi:hypothetical protein
VVEDPGSTFKLIGNGDVVSRKSPTEFWASAGVEKARSVSRNMLEIVFLIDILELINFLLIINY